MRRRLILSALMAILALLLVACPTAGTPTGSLTVSITGLPAGVDADVTVTGPDGFDQTLTNAQVLIGIRPGVYTASASFVSDGTDGYTPTVTGSPAEVTSSASATIGVVYALQSGSLQVTINGLPTGVHGGEVTVSGAGGFSQRVTATTTIANLRPGIYVLTAETALTDDPTVSEAYDVATPPPATVEVISNASSSATTTYARRPGSGRLWKPLQDDPLLFGFASAQLASSGTPTPSVSLTAPPGGASDQGVTFDGEGNAWVTNNTLRTLSRYDASNLEADATLTPNVTIATDGASLVVPVGLGFDATGNLWIADFGAGQLQMFTPTQLAASGTPTPAVVIGTDGTSLQAPCGLAFDAGGNLWASNLVVGGGRVEMYTPTQLVTSGTPTPQVSLGSDGTSLEFSCGLAFDAAGNLWATGGSPSNRLEMFSSDQLTTSGDPTPTIIIDSDGTSLSNPFALAFDNSGNLWANATNDETLQKFTPDQLASSGAPTPDVTIGGGMTDVGAFAFSPAPTNLPINAP